jgi:hypothetical protein
MREHIQHFDIEHLKLLAAQEGFDLVDFSKSETPMMSEKIILPNLNAVFRSTCKTNRIVASSTCFTLKKKIEKYIAANLGKRKKKEKIIAELVESRKPVYAWGIGREFLYLYKSAGLKYCALAGLIDENLYKQKTACVGGRNIAGRAILDTAGSDTVLIITATAHTAAIRKLLEKTGYAGQIVEF